MSTIFTGRAHGRWDGRHQVSHASPTGCSPQRALTVIGILAILAVTLAFPSWVGSAHILLLLLPVVAAWAVWRSSVLAGLFLAQVAAGYGLPLLTADHEPDPLVVAAVVLWSSGLAVGVLVGRSPTTASTTRVWGPPRWPQFVLASGLILLQAYLTLSGRLGYEAQLSTGMSAPVGLLSLLTTPTPVITVMLLVSALGSGKRVTAAATVVIAHAAVVSLSGFRGAVAVYFIAAACAAWLTLPAASPWRRAPRVAIAFAFLAVIAISGFVSGAHVRQDVAIEQRASSKGSKVFGWDEALPILSERLDHTTPLQRAVELRDDSTLQHAVSWSAQLEAFIPRFLWPEKPVVDYGQQVTAALHGQAYAPSSSTITNIGDLLVNFGIAGVLAASVLLGAGLRVAELRVRGGAGTPSLVLAVGLSSFILLQEMPLLLALAGLIRDSLVALAMWIACGSLARRADQRAGCQRWVRSVSPERYRGGSDGTRSASDTL